MRSHFFLSNQQQQKATSVKLPAADVHPVINHLVATALDGTFWVQKSKVSELLEVSELLVGQRKDGR